MQHRAVGIMPHIEMPQLAGLYVRHLAACGQLLQLGQMVQRPSGAPEHQVGNLAPLGAGSYSFERHSLAFFVES